VIRARQNNKTRYYTDNYRHKGLRQKLVKDLEAQGIKDRRVLLAINNVPRHFFLDTAFAEIAYQNRAFPIEADQTISHPYTVAFQTELLEIQKGDKVLEIGTGSGYQACILAHMGAKVYSIERQEKLFNKTSAFLPKIGFRQIRTLFGDGYKGAPMFAPFDKIIVTAGAQEIPRALFDQLAIGGKLVIPVGANDRQEMLLYTKLSAKEVNCERHGMFTFVPFLKGINKNN
jgi:protein-L-isoaspartate(D-aspartate) O-methyltransferase